MRPYWKGYLKLALVSCPIALHAACSTAERIPFRQTARHRRSLDCVPPSALFANDPSVLRRGIALA